MLHFAMAVYTIILDFSQSFHLGQVFVLAIVTWYSNHYCIYYIQAHKNMTM